MKITGHIKVNAPQQIMKRIGVTAGGAVQRFHTANVMRRIQKYMPFRSGVTIKLMIAQSPTSEPFINVITPYARFLYYGKQMIDPEINTSGFLTNNGWRSRKGAVKVVSDRPLKYTTTKNPQAGPFWDKRLKAVEGKVMQSELQKYVDRLGKGR